MAPIVTSFQATLNLEAKVVNPGSGKPVPHGTVRGRGGRGWWFSVCAAVRLLKGSQGLAPLPPSSPPPAPPPPQVGELCVRGCESAAFSSCRAWGWLGAAHCRARAPPLCAAAAAPARRNRHHTLISPPPCADSVMLGYWGDDAATAAVLDAEEGWMRTGDLATLDAQG